LTKATASVRDADTVVLLGYPSDMRPRLVGLVLLAMATIGATPLRSQQAATRTVTIRVSDQTGAGIKGAQVRCVPAPDSAPVQMETDSHGNLSLDLQPGNYAVSVSAQGFKTAALNVDVAPIAGDATGEANQLVGVTLQIGAMGSPVPVYPKDSLVLTAEGYHAPVALSLAEFCALPHVSLTVHNVHTDKDETYNGVALSTLLAMINAPTGKALRGEALATYLVATGSDGYSAVISLAEADPSFHDGQILVADVRDGQPLAKNGPFQLIVSEDKRPARWVHNLDSISLQSAHRPAAQN
jgi:hypothetical protein